MNFIKPLLLLALPIYIGCASPPPPEGEVELASIFQNHMVLQRDAIIPIWGYSDPGVEVEIDFLEKKYQGTTDTLGFWEIELPPQPAGGPFEIYVSGGLETDTLTDVLFGDVWLCSGQSNMAMKLKKTECSEEEIKSADWPNVRHFETRHYGKRKSKKDLPSNHSQWTVCTPSTAGDFAAIGYYFSKNIQPEIGVPIGLLNLSKGSSRIEEWMRAETQVGELSVQAVDTTWDASTASSQFEKMILPVTNFPIKGVLWYQGESNGDLEDATRYKMQFMSLITDWRTQWKQPDMPWIFAQAACWEPYSGKALWAELRASQAATLSLPNTAMVATYDISHANDLHPKNKKDLGHRFALAARRLVYGHEVLASGPVIHSVKSNNDSLYLTFDHIGKGLQIRPTGNELRGFEVCENNGDCYPIKAWIEKNRVIVFREKMPASGVIRFAWSNAPTEANLFNREGMPCFPFSVRF